MSGATALAVVAKTGVADMRTETTDEVCAAESKGYHVTPHIREYYEKARF